MRKLEAYNPHEVCAGWGIDPFKINDAILQGVQHFQVLRTRLSSLIMPNNARCAVGYSNNDKRYPDLLLKGPMWTN